MHDNKSYPGIDYFRIAAAFLIIGIHTSPLSSFSGTGDFILTRILARTAVPFFFMTSGFFLISQYSRDAQKLKGFLKRTGMIYGAAILLYLPLNIYNGYFSQDYLLPNILKDIVFDGTLYHLWYLPASMLGAALAWAAARKLGMKKALLLTVLFYLLGLPGDSYYGAAVRIPLLKDFYWNIFQISDYTRNGVFFAPVFFLLGGIIARRPDRIPLKHSLAGLGASLLLMLGEGLLLHNLHLPRHDSMYLSLLPCMYFLFTSLTHIRGRRVLFLRTSALVLYIIHPMMIVVVRMAAGFSGLQALLVKNSLIHFLAVSISSCAVALPAALWLDRRKLKQKTPESFLKDRAWIELNLDNLKHNVKVLTQAMPNTCQLMAVVKAQSYGHGAFQAASCLNQMGVSAFATATVDEAVDLRRWGITGDILILGYTDPSRAKELHKYDLTQTVVDFRHAVCLNKAKIPVKVHLKIDTGMHRLGFGCDEISRIMKTCSAKYLDIRGIYTHLCVSDSLEAGDIAFTNRQTQSFYSLLDTLAQKGIHFPKVHIQSSYGLLNYPQLSCDYVRAGIALYGVHSSPGGRTRLRLDLRPVLSLHSRIILIRKVPRGESAGYQRAWTALRDSRIAILPIGYADGIPRNLSCQNGEALIRGVRVPIIGRICMDQLAVDITDLPQVAVGDTATLIGDDGTDSLLASDTAGRAGTISNELLSRIGPRIKNS